MDNTLRRLFALCGFALVFAFVPTQGRAAETPMLPRGDLMARPITVMIDNHSDARPQSGFEQAAVVFEALAEGGITRFMFVYNGDSAMPEVIGPYEAHVAISQNGQRDSLRCMCMLVVRQRASQ